MPPRLRKYMPKKSAVKRKPLRGQSSAARATGITTMVNRSTLRDHTIVADRYLTKMSVSWFGQLAATTSAALAPTIYGNSLYQPLNTGVPINTTITATQGSTIAREPMGYAALSALYNSYKIRGSRIKVTMCPTNGADNSLLTVVPVQSTLAVTTPQILMNQRYARWRMCTSTNNVKQNTVVHYMSSNEALGMTKRQFEDQLPVAVGAAPANQLDWFWEIVYTTQSGAVNNAVIGFTVEVDYYVELSDPVYQQT